ncbi:hypothetical protein BV900_02745 [Agrobacterium tumefaciens]|nr:hypothetical protein BV900_02745 [Agrobacterium tumefaciens]
MMGSQAAERIEDADFPFWDWCFKSGQGKKAAKKTSRKLFFSWKKCLEQYFKLSAQMHERHFCRRKQSAPIIPALSRNRIDVRLRGGKSSFGAETCAGCSPAHGRSAGKRLP